MSNLFLKSALKRAAWIVVWGALAWGQAGELAAQQPAPEAKPEPPPVDVAQSIDALARFMVESTQGKQPTVPYPESARPELPAVLCSIDQPLCVHATPESAPDAAAWLLELQAAHALVGALGFPVPRPDAGRGGTFELDVYLTAFTTADGEQTPAADSMPRRTSAEVDEPAGATLLDGATSYAQIDPAVPAGQRFTCAVQAIAEAGLRSDDPSESRLASSSVAAFVAYLATGSYGCVDRIEAVQLAPELGLAAPETDARTAVQLALLLISRRHDGGDGAFIREVWQLARQKSPEVDALRISPSFFEALDRALKNSGESFEAINEELGVARYFATRGDRDGGKGALPALPASISVPITTIEPFTELPAHLPVHAPLLGPLGSAYAQIDTSAAPAGSRLDVWLRGDVGPKLALTAVRLDADGREIGRMTAPARRLPQSFLPVELESGTASVLLVVTALVEDFKWLGHLEGERDFGFRLILDKR